MVESSIQHRQVSLPGSTFPLIGLPSTSNLPSTTVPLSVLPISSSNSQTETSTTSPSSSTPSASNTMSATLPLSVLPAVTSTGSTLPTSVPSFAWSSYPSTIDTCTSVTLNWTYSGPQGTLQFVLISNASPHTSAAISRKRAGQSTTIATGVDSNALLWTWPKVNVTAGQYIVEATGTDVTVISSTFSIVSGADTSCLANAQTHTTIFPAETSTTWIPEPSVTPLPTSSSRSTTSTGIIAGGIVAGVAVLIIAVLVYRMWVRLHGQLPQVAHSQSPPDPTRRDRPSQYVASGAEPPPLAEKDPGSAHPLEAAAAESNSPLIPNRRPPSSLLSEPRTPVPPYTSHIQAREQMAGSVMDVSTIASRSSVALSDATSTAGLMRTMSSCPPSYLTVPSPPPSYVTHTTRDAMTPRSPYWSYRSSSS